MQRLATALLFGAALAVAGVASEPSRADDGALVQVLVESASTPKEHAALAGYYERQAAAARKEAAKHRSMGKAYAGGKFFDVQRMKAHCEKLAALYEEQATEFHALAQAHRANAE